MVTEPRKIRNTRQRNAVLEAVRRVKSHPTADEVYRMVKEKIPQISLGTVYRNLELLCELGLVQKLDSPGGQRRFDGNPRNHYHIRCISCNKIIDLEIETIPDLDKYLVKKTDFEITGHRLEFLGICPDCQDSKD